MQDPLILKGEAELGQKLNSALVSSTESFTHIQQLLSDRPVRSQSLALRHKPIQKKLSGPSRKQAMAGLSADKYVQLFKDVPSVTKLLNELSQTTGISPEDLRFEWGHLAPQLAGGANKKDNLVVILKTVNSEMMPIELCLKTFARQYPIRYQAKALLTPFSGSQYLSIATATGIQCDLTIKDELEMSCHVTAAQPHRRQFPVLRAVGEFFLTGTMSRVGTGSTYFNRMSTDNYTIACRGADGSAVTAALEPHLKPDTSYINIFECTTPGGRKYSSNREETPTILISPGGSTVYKHRSRTNFGSLGKTRRALLPEFDKQNQENQSSDSKQERSKTFVQNKLRLSFFTPERAVLKPILTSESAPNVSASATPAAVNEPQPRRQLHRRSATQ